MSQIFEIIMSKRPTEYKPAIFKVITDEATAGRIYNQICRKLRIRHTLDVELGHIFMVVNFLLARSSSFGIASRGEII